MTVKTRLYRTENKKQKTSHCGYETEKKEEKKKEKKNKKKTKK